MEQNKEGLQPEQNTCLMQQQTSLQPILDEEILLPSKPPIYEKSKVPPAMPVRPAPTPKNSSSTATGMGTVSIVFGCLSLSIFALWTPLVFSILGVIFSALSKQFALKNHVNTRLPKIGLILSLIGAGLLIVFFFTIIIISAILSATSGGI